MGNEMALVSNNAHGRLLPGMKKIAGFYGLPVAKANRLAAKGLLPGVFKMGREFFLDPIAAEEIIAKKAKAGIALADAA